MTDTKKSFLTAGAILGIVEASVMILTGIIMFCCIGLVDEQFITTMLEAEKEATVALTSSEMSFAITAMRVAFVAMGTFIMAMSAAMLVFSILVLKNKNKGIYKKGFVITLLVLSVINGNILTAAFMIVTLCLKDKTAAEIVEENIQQ